MQDVNFEPSFTFFPPRCGFKAGPSVGRGDPQRSAAKRFVVLGLPSVLRKLLQLELNLCERRILGACETSVDNLLANMKFSNPSVKSCVS